MKKLIALLLSAVLLLSMIPMVAATEFLDDRGTTYAHNNEHIENNNEFLRIFHK